MGNTHKLVKDAQNYVDMYLDWVNNFLSITCFAEYYEVTDASARRIIKLGYIINLQRE